MFTYELHLLYLHFKIECATLNKENHFLAFFDQANFLRFDPHVSRMISSVSMMMCRG